MNSHGGNLNEISGIATSQVDMHEEMEAYDALPHELREVLRNFPFLMSALEVSEALTYLTVNYPQNPRQEIIEAIRDDIRLKASQFVQHAYAEQGFEPLGSMTRMI